MSPNTITHLQYKATCGKDQVCATEGMRHSWYGQETSRKEMAFEPDIEENGQDFDGEGKREGEDVVGREGHSGRKVQSAFRGAASRLVNNCVQRNWTMVDRTT